MKKSIVIGVFTLLNFYLSAKKEVNWTIPEGELIAVYECSKASKKTELLRLYTSGQYEHVLYEEKVGKKEFVLRNLGRYQKQGRKISFSNPSFKSFTGKFRYGSFYQKQHLYFAWSDALLGRKKPAFYHSNESRNWKPFFMALHADEIVYNREAATELDLAALVDYLVKGKTSDSAKINALETFLVRSIAYDYVGFETEILAHDPQDITAFIAGPERLAVCSGYSNALSLFAELAGIEIQQVEGYTRFSFSDLSKLNGYHVWSKILIDGKYELHDLTWADSGEELDETWINVRPEILISSHFPNHMEDQLLAIPMDQATFLKSACIVPYVRGAQLVNAPIPSRIFVDKKLPLTFAKDARISIYKIDEDVLNAPKSFESIQPQKELVLFPVSDFNRTITGDSATYTLDLNSFMNVFYIEVDDAYSIKFVAVNGTEEELLRNYADSPNRSHYEQYIKGILAAIKLRDYAQLKVLAGSDNSVFFDKKGQFKMKDTHIETIENWDGAISDLMVLENSAVEKNQDGEMTERIWNSYFVEIPYGLKFTLALVDGEYTVSEMK
ncbi:MAG: hypothetical protein RJA13_2061 [Bacteroidota bacterium]